MIALLIRRATNTTLLRLRPGALEALLLLLHLVVDAWAATNTQHQLRGKKNAFSWNNTAFSAHNASEVAATRCIAPFAPWFAVAVSASSRPVDKMYICSNENQPPAQEALL